MVASVIIDGNHAVWHTDIEGNPVLGTIHSASKGKVSGVAVSKTGDIVTFPSHPHSLVDGEPSDYRTHSIVVTGTGKLTISSEHIVRAWDVVNVSDEAGGNATMVATQEKLFSN